MPLVKETEYDIELVRLWGWDSKNSRGIPRGLEITGRAGGMKDTAATETSRRGLLKVFAAAAITAAPSMSQAFGIGRGAGDIRQIALYSGRTGESINTVYWVEGEYIPEALAEIRNFMRDWRNDKQIQIDTRLIDIWAASRTLLETNEPYMLLSGYRSPETNAMLRSRSRSVARNSLHMKGQASDLRLQGRSVRQMAGAAAACRAGGVGKYSGSNFVHMDCGPIRIWGS